MDLPDPDVSFLYRMCMWAAGTGVRIAACVYTPGLEKIDPSRNYIFMSNHISNLDPPVTLPLSTADLGDGEERTIWLPDSWKNHDDWFSRASGPREIGMPVSQPCAKQ